MLGDDGLELLSEAECFRMASTVAVGRVAVTLGALPAVFPVNFCFDGVDVVFRTGPGTKLAAASSGTVVAFEVDEIDALYHDGWSVLLIGTARVVTDHDELERLRHLPVAPWAPGRREYFVTMAPEIVTGRRIVHHPVPE